MNQPKYRTLTADAEAVPVIAPLGFSVVAGILLSPAIFGKHKKQKRLNLFFL